MANDRKRGSGSSRVSHHGKVAGPKRPAGRTSREAKSGDLRTRGLGGEQVEGRQAVKVLLQAGRRRVREIWLSDSVERAGIVEEITTLAFDLKVPVRTVSRGRLDNAARSEGSQGIIAFSENLMEQPLEELVKPYRGAAPFLVALDGVTDPYNLGAILRSADCAGVTGIILPAHRSVHLTPAATKSAAGAIEYLRFSLVPGISGALQELSKAGVWCVGLDGAANGSIYEVSLFDQPVAMVFGAEDRGLSQLVKQRCDMLASIPQFGHIPSLNVSNAAALALFEVVRARTRT